MINHLFTFWRKRENLVNTLTRKFIDEMKEYQNVQQAYKVNIRKKAVQQIKYVKEDATPEEVEQIMRSDGGREELYQQSILQGGVNDTIKWVLIFNISYLYIILLLSRKRSHVFYSMIHYKKANLY